MALAAGDVRVLARERVIRPCVVERRGVLPLPGVVTPRAGSRQAPAMGVWVAARALAFESGPPDARTARRELHGRGALETCRVTRRTLRRRVALLERITGASRVIEALGRTAGPLNELEVPSGMLGVTARACAARVDAGVEAASLVLEPRDLAVTGEAPLRRGLLPPAVTLRAVRRALEGCVRASQRPGGNLCERA